MNLGEILACLDPLEQKAVGLVYFERRTPAEAATLLAVEPVAVAAALAVAFRRVARWVMSEDGRTEDAVPVGAGAASTG